LITATPTNGVSIYEDNYDSRALGNLCPTAQWACSTPNTNITVSNAFSTSGANSVFLNRNTTDTTLTTTGFGPLAERIAIDFYLRPILGNNRWRYIYIRDNTGNNTTGINIRFSNTAFIQYNNAGTWANICASSGYVIDRWYHVRVITDPSQATDSFSVLVEDNGAFKCSNTGLQYAGNVNNINSMQFLVSANDSADAYLDTVRIYRVGKLDVQAGSANPVAGTYSSSAAYLSMLQLRISETGGQEDVRITQIVFNASGTADDRSVGAGGDITNNQVCLYNDLDNDRAWEATDVQIGTCTNYSADNGIVTFSGLTEIITAGTTENWLLVYKQLAGTASDGETFIASFNPATGITANTVDSSSSSFTVTPAITGSSISGNTMSINSNPPVQSNWSPEKGATICASNPTITFTLDETGDCKWSLTDQAYGAMTGDCAGDGTTSISCPVSGLPAGAATVYLACRDSYGNSNTAANNEHINYTFDNNPPDQSNWNPAKGEVTCPSVSVSFNLNKNGDCKWSLTDQAYGVMPNDCTGDGSTSITCSTNGMPSGATNLYVACQDSCGVQDTATTNEEINYAIDSGGVVQAGWAPTAGTVITASAQTISFTTNKNASCRWSLSDQSYAAMADTCGGGGSTSISCNVAGLTDGAEVVYLACRDACGIEDTAATNMELNYTVDTLPPAPSGFNPASGSEIYNTSQVITFTTDENAWCRWALTDQTYDAMTNTCGGSGTTSQSCFVTGFSWGIGRHAYISCRDQYNNKDTATTNEDLVYTCRKPIVTIDKYMSQPSSAMVDSANKLMGAFSLISDVSTPKATSITISETGTVNAAGSLSNVKLWYDTDGTYDGNETQFGGGGTFNGSNYAVFNGTIQLFSTATVYVYVTLNVAGGAIAGQTIDIEITAAANVICSDADVAGAFPVQLAGITNIVGGQATSLTVSPDTADMEVGSNLQFNVTGKDAYGNTTSNYGTITWSIDTGIGAINPTSGLLTATSVGMGHATAFSSYGPSDVSGTINVIGTIPNGNYSFRKQITVKNNVSTVLPKGYSVMFNFDHAACYSGGTGKCKDITGKDVRIFYYNGDEYIPIHRVNEPGCQGDIAGCTGEGGGYTPWNNANTEIWFPTYAQVPGNGTDGNYWMYYGNPSAGNPPDNPDNVYIWHDDFSSNSLSRYTMGKSLDIHGDNSSLIVYDAVNGRVTFNTGDNCGAGLRLTSLDLADVLVQADEYVEHPYPYSGTTNFTLRWKSNTSAFYSHMSNNLKVKYTGAGGDCTTNPVSCDGTQGYNSPCIGRADLAERNCQVSGIPATKVYFPPAFCGDPPVIKRFRYGIYRDKHFFWYHKRTNFTADSSGTDWSFTSGQIGIQANQQKGWFDNLIVRYFVSPEPTITFGAEQSRPDYKVEGNHPFITQVSQGEQNAQMLKLAISTSVAETLSQIKIKSKNTNDGDVTGVTAYYTGTSNIFESSTPFGAVNSPFTGGMITFNGSQPLPSNAVVYVFIVYNISPVAQTGDALDLRIDAGGITLTSGSYPGTVTIDPAGSRSIAPPQTLSDITVINSNTSNVRPGDIDQQILRIDFPVKGAGSPQTLQSITISSSNISDDDVSGVSAYYTGTMPFFNIGIPFGQKHQPFGGGTVTFTGTLDFEAQNATHSIYIAFDIADKAVNGHTVDARILVNDIKIEGISRSPLNGDPVGSRTVFLPSGTVTGLAPCQMLVDSNPSFMSIFVTSFYTTPANQGNCSLTNNFVTDLATSDTKYAGLWMKDPERFDPQQEWVEFSYNISSYGITGRAINSLTFNSELYLVGIEGGTAPTNNPADWGTIYESKVQIFNYTTGLWEDMGTQFLTPTPSGWRTAGGEAYLWDETTDNHPEKPLIRAKTSGFSDSYLNRAGIIKIRVWIKGALNANFDESSMVFNTALLNLNYGSTFEQANWRWLDADESPAAIENRYFNAPQNADLHLRVGIRSNFAEKGAHYLGVQYDTNPNFTAPTLMTTSTAALRFWNDTNPDRQEGDPVSLHFLSGSPVGGIYHEDGIPPAQTKDSGLLYEEDFTIKPLTVGTYYLRVVLLNGDGTFNSTLNSYAVPIKLVVETTGTVQAAYNWAPNNAPYTPLGADTPLEFSVNTDYILAVRMEGRAATSNTWRLEYQKNPFTNPGDWTPVTLTCGTCDWKSVNGAWGADEAAVPTAGFVTGAGTGTSIAGRYDENGSFGTVFALGANQYTEFWWAVRATDAASGNAYRFRVTNAGATAQMSYARMPEARQTVREQTSYRWADENEATVAQENTAAGVAVNQPLHLRVGIRSRNNLWSSHKIALQYDTDSSFPSPILVTSTSGAIVHWDDTDHTAGDPVSGVKLLSGFPYAGVYHESNAQPAAQNSVMNLVYEEDFTVAVTAPGTFFLRVVSVDVSGGNPQPLDLYSSTITVNAAVPSNYQTYYSWAEDSASPHFSPTNNILPYLTGNMYLLAVQIQNWGAAPSVYNWQLQYKRTSEPPGDWTNITTSSSEWMAANCTFGVEGRTISTTSFQTNGGVGIGTAESGYYSEKGVITDSLGAGSYTEYWYCVKPTTESSKKTYEFRVTNTGSTAGFIYNIYPQAAEPTTEMVGYRWADANEAALDIENASINGAPGDMLHLRIGVRGNYGAYQTHRLALQYDTSITFPSPVLITTGTPAIRMWDDPDRSEGTPVYGVKLISGDPMNGLYRESASPFPETGRANLIYEEDFTIQPLSVGTYFIRAVEIDASGNFLKLLDKYTKTAEINITYPIDYQTKYNWGVNTSGPTWNGQNLTLDFSTGVTYIVAVKIENDSAVSSNYDWQLQYQKDPYGSPGDWTNITATSPDWQVSDGAWGTDGAVVSTASFVTTGFDHCTGCSAVNGVYSETGKIASYSLPAHRYTEIWYSIRADASTFGNAYRFRVTNSGSTFGISYSRYPECRIVARQQASYRWADINESAIDIENAAASVVVGDTLHLRVGIRSKNALWSNHKLALQYDTDSAFTAPTLMTSSTTIKSWDDSGHSDGDPMSAPNILSSSPWDGIYHEDNNQPVFQSKDINLLYEEDFTVKPDAAGVYYFRVVEVDASGNNPVPLDIYSNTIGLTVVNANNMQTSYNWSENTVTPAFIGENIPVGMTSGKIYILAIQIDHIDPASTYNWRLQYQKDPDGTPGPWTEVTPFSSDWKAADGPFGVDGAVVLPSSFVTTYSGSGTPVAGKYSETGLVSSFNISGARYTEFWFSVKPQPSAMNYDYRFRLTNGGAVTGFRYDRHPAAKHPPTTGSIAISELMGCCTDNPSPVLTLSCEDPAGTACNTADSMRFSCNNANWSPWYPFSVSSNAFSITTGAGCVPQDGEKTVFVEYKNEYNAIQTLHASDKTVYDTTPPQITSIPNIQTITGVDCPLHGTTDGVICDVSLKPSPVCTVWYQSRPSSSYPLFPGSPNQFTVVVGWTDNMETYGSQWKLQGAAAFGDPIQTPDTENPWQQFYNIGSTDLTDQHVLFTVYDKVGHTDAVTIDINADNADPDNPAVTGFASDSKVITLVDGTWYPYDNPYFEWPSPNDNPVGHNSGIDGYYVGFSADPGLIPSNFQKGRSYNSTGALTCGTTYYLRIRSRDHVCNVPATITTFTYRYDNNPPSIVNNISGCPSCDNTWHNTPGALYDIDFTDSCGDIAKAEYTVYSGTGTTGYLIIPWTTIADNINFPTYTTDWPVAFDSLPDGINYVTVRLTDEAANKTTSVDTFYVRKDTVPPQIIYNAPISAGGATPWYGANAAIDVDLQWASGSPIVKFEYRIGSGAWTTIWSGSQSASFTTNWTIPWASLPEGISRISLRGTDAAGNVTTHDFTAGSKGFLFRKDISAPDNPATPVIGWSDSSKTIPLVSGGAYSYPNPYFEWAQPNDNPSPANSGVDGYYVGFSTNPAFDPSDFQTGSFYTAQALACNADYYLRIKTRDNAAPNNVSSPMTAFQFKWAGSITITDNQIGDDTWRNSNSGVYDVDFRGGCTANINTVEYTIWSAPDTDAGAGVEIIPWTVFLGPNLGVNVYSVDWKLRDADFSTAAEGINWVSVRVTDANGLVMVRKDVFYILKDTHAPNVPISAFLESSDYLWVSPMNGQLYFGNGMTAPQTFTVSGTADDSLSGLNRVTFGTAFGDSPANAAVPAAWTANYDIAASDTTAEVITVTVYDNAGNSNAVQMNTIRNNSLSITYETMTPPSLPNFVKFKLYYPDGMTEMTSGGADGLHTTITSGIDISAFVRAYDKNGALVNVFDDQADTTADGIVIDRLEYLAGAGDMCGSVSGTGSWCLEMHAGGCVSSVNPHYIGVFANNIRADAFYTKLVEEKSIDGDFGTAIAPPVALGDPGTFAARSGPDYLRVVTKGDALITADSTIGSWCAAASCPFTCIGAFCSNTASKITAKPDFVKRNTGAGPFVLAFKGDNVAPATGEWAWDTTQNAIVLFDNPAAGFATMTATLNGQSEMVCVEIMDACDGVITTGKWNDETVRLTLSQAPGSGKTIVRNDVSAVQGFANVTAPASFVAPNQFTVTGDIINGTACVTLTAESIPNDTPQTPIMITAEYFGSPALGHTGGVDTPGFVLIRPSVGIAAGSTSFAGITTVQNAFISYPNTATQAIVLSPAWRHDGRSILFISRQSNPCGGAAASGDLPYGDFNLFMMNQSAGSLDGCVRLTRNGSDGFSNFGVAPYSEVTWSSSNEYAVFAAEDKIGSGATKLFWVSATAPTGVSLGRQYDFPPAGPAITTESVWTDINSGDTSVAVALNQLTPIAPGEKVLVYEVDPAFNKIVKREIKTVASISHDTNNINTTIAFTEPVANSFVGMTNGGMSFVEYPVTLRQLGQNVVPLDDGSKWLDPDWSGTYAECDAANRDKLIAVRIPAVETEDTVCTPACSIDANSSTNANIVMIDGAKNSEGLYSIDGATSNLTRITQFTDNSVWPLKPRWSPDCKMIAFVAWDRTPDVINPVPPSKTSIYIINLSASYSGFVPAALPVTSLSEPGVYKVYDYNKYNLPAYEPDWSADGKLVSYAIDKHNALDIEQVNSGMESIVEQLFSGSDYDSYLEYIPDQAESQGAVFAPQLVGQVQYNELYLTQCPSNSTSTCPNKPNTPYAQISQMSAGTGAYLRMLTISDESLVTSGGGLLFHDGIVTAVFPPNVIASDTVFYNSDPTPYCGGGAAPGPNCPVDPTSEYIVQAGEAREFFPDGSNFGSYIRLIFHYCDNDNDGRVDAGTEGINSATANGTKAFTFDSITGYCFIDGSATSGGSVDVDTLGVYNWDKASSAWIRMNGSVDKTSKTITIFSSHFSLYDTLGFRMGFSPQTVQPLTLYDIHTYPNPYVESVNSMDGIRFAGAGLNQGNVTISIKIYDLRGSLVNTLMSVVPSDYDTNPTVNENGAFTLYNWRRPVNASGRPLAAGVYIYYLVARAGEYEVTHKGKFSVVR